MKLLIIGYKRSGKDTAAEYFESNFGLKYLSSSVAAAEIFIFDKLKRKYGYQNFNQCFEDRVNHRKEWYNLIKEYNFFDRAKLAKEILIKNNCYVGMRSVDELNECKAQNVFDLIIWVDAEKRVGRESLESCTVTKEDADIIILNNDTEKDFLNKLNRLGKILFK